MFFPWLPVWLVEGYFSQSDLLLHPFFSPLPVSGRFQSAGQTGVVAEVAKPGGGAVL